MAFPSSSPSPLAYYVLFAAALMISLSVVAPTVRAAPLDDLITELPGWGRTPTPQFSGYLDASKGCDTALNGPVCKIHYWLALADGHVDVDADADYNADAADNAADNTPPPKTVLWLNGGPGSSSLLGWLQEVGPLLLNATGGLMENPWAWTKAGVNLLVIEAPMGVGFSYCSRQRSDQKPCANTDTNTAEASRAALVDFFVHKFPELAANGGTFYIAGESYAGVYIPTLAKELLQHPDARDGAVPLRGILVGDPCTDNAAQKDSMDSAWYAHKYGLVDNEVYDVLVSDECSSYYKNSNGNSNSNGNKNSNGNSNNSNGNSNNSNSNNSNKQAGTHGSKSHRSVGKRWSNHATAADLNQELRGIADLVERKEAAEALYRSRVLGEADVDANVDTNVMDDDDNDREQHAPHTLLRAAAAAASGSSDDDDVTTANAATAPPPPAKCKLAYRKFLLSSSNALSQGWKDLYIDDYSLFAPVTSKEDEQMVAYFGRKDVRTALHVTDTGDEAWPMPDVGFSYTKEYNACNWKPREFIKHPDTTMVDVYRDIVPLLARTWIYNGDTDPCVSYEGTREAVKQILVDELDGGSYRPWFYKQEAASLEVLAEKSILFGPGLVAQTLDKAQFAGEVTSYEQGLSFVTFHGSGHMVPQFRPQAALHFLKRFLEHEHEHAIDAGGAGSALAPLLPTNATLLAMSDAAFETAMDDWTEAARDHL